MANSVHAKPASEHIFGGSLTKEIIAGCGRCDSSVSVCIVILKLLTTARLDTIVIKEKRTPVTRSNEQNGNNKLEALERA